MLTDKQQREHQLPNHHLWVRPSVTPERIDDTLLLSFLSVRRAIDLTFRQAAALLSNRDLLYRVLVTRFGVHPRFLYGDLFFMTGQMLNAGSCVCLSDHGRDRYNYAVG